MTLKCIRCSSEEVSGGYVSCSACGKEWLPGADDGASGDFKAGSLSSILEAALERESLGDILVALECLCLDKANLIRAGLQDGTHSPELGQKWAVAEGKLEEIARWAVEAGL